MYSSKIENIKLEDSTKNLIKVNKKFIMVSNAPKDFSSYIQELQNALKGLYVEVGVEEINSQEVCIQGVTRLPVYRLSYKEFLRYIRRVIKDVQTRLTWDLKTMKSLQTTGKFLNINEKQKYKQDKIFKEYRLETLAIELNKNLARINL